MKASKNNLKESILFDKEKSEEDGSIKFISEALCRPIFRKHLTADKFRCWLIKKQRRMGAILNQMAI